MNDFTTQMTTTFLSFAGIIIGYMVHQLKKFLLTKGGEKAVKITEIIARNAVEAVEQVSDELDLTSEDKLTKAKSAVIDGLSQYHINLTETQLETFIEAAVKRMNDEWKKGQ